MRSSRPFRPSARQAGRCVQAAALLFLACWMPLVAAGAPAGGTSPSAPARILAPLSMAMPSSPPPDGATLCSQSRARALRAEMALSVRTDPTPNQMEYDALYYRIDLTIDPDIERIYGQVTVRGRVLAGADSLAEVELDLADTFLVSAVRRSEGGDSLAFEHGNGILRVHLPHPLPGGEEFSFQVVYRGNPERGAFNFDTHAGAPMIWTLSAPYGARGWWPCKDYPGDKADSVDILVHAPSGLLAAANGVLRQTSDDGTTAFRWWHEGHPIATYLVSLAVHPYNVYSDWYRPAAGDSMQIVFYNFNSSLDEARPVQEKVKDMIAYFSSRYGPYPFLDEKYGHAEFLWNGGMENQTISSLGTYSETVVAHELSHMWWGDYVTCRDFHDIWLNEGFATYSEALWAEASGGTAAYRQKMADFKYLGPGTVYVDDLHDSGRIYDQFLSYDKGSWVLHMLRHVVGDDNFFRILQEYRSRYAGGGTTTADFEGVAEEVAGLDLHAFFQEWIQGERYPIYSYSWSTVQTGTGWDLRVRIRQVQDWQIFTMPVDLTITTDSGEQTRVEMVSDADEVFHIALQQEPRKLELDRDEWILRQVLDPVPSPSWNRPLLLVNGVSWTGSNGPEMRRAYEAQPFTGESDFDFWDCFPAPADGYPNTLPAPVGHGSVPAAVLGNYQTVVWLGNYLGGDAEAWTASPMYGYLQAGGNILLLSRTGNLLLSAPFRDYLGVQWAGTDSVYDCVAAADGLTDMRVLAPQASSTWFPLQVGPESTLLYKSSSGHVPEWGIGVIRQPAGSEGGRFAFLSGRPYRWNYEDLRRNISAILTRFLPQKIDPQASLALNAAPNPARDRSLIRFYLPSPAPVSLGVWDVAGRRIRVLRDGPSPAGWNAELWDGSDDAGHRVGSGIYFTRLVAGGKTREWKLVLLH